MLKDLFSFNYGSDYAIGFTQLNFWIFFLFAMIGLAIWGKKPLMKTIFFTAIGVFFILKPQEFPLSFFFSLWVLIIFLHAGFIQLRQ